MNWKMLAALARIALAATLLAACGNNNEDKQNPPPEDHKNGEIVDDNNGDIEDNDLDMNIDGKEQEDTNMGNDLDPIKDENSPQEEPLLEDRKDEKDADNDDK
jgi:hypothetical protein